MYTVGARYFQSINGENKVFSSRHNANSSHKAYVTIDSATASSKLSLCKHLRCFKSSYSSSM